MVKPQHYCRIISHREFVTQLYSVCICTVTQNRSPNVHICTQVTYSITYIESKLGYTALKNILYDLLINHQPEEVLKEGERKKIDNCRLRRCHINVTSHLFSTKENTDHGFKLSFSWYLVKKTA